MKYLKQVFGGNLQQYTMVLALVLLAIIFDVLSDGKMLTASNAQALLAGNAYVLVLAIGMVMVIVIGHIDLSVGSVAAFVGMTVAISTSQWGLPWWAGLLLGMLVGTLIGAWHGFWLSKMGIPGFITTLAGMMIFRGLTIWVSKSISVPASETAVCSRMRVTLPTRVTPARSSAPGRVRISGMPLPCILARNFRPIGVRKVRVWWKRPRTTSRTRSLRPQSPEMSNGI